MSAAAKHGRSLMVTCQWLEVVAVVGLVGVHVHPLVVVLVAVVVGLA